MRTGLLLAALLAAAPPARAQVVVEPYEARWGLIWVGGLVLYYDAKGPMSYMAWTARDLPPGAVRVGEVSGERCQNGLSLPLLSDFSGVGANLAGAAGDGGFEQVLLDLRRSRPALRGLYDVKADQHNFSILGLFRRVCVRVSAQGFQ